MDEEMSELIVEPPWVVAAVDQRLAQMDPFFKGFNAQAGNLVVTPMCELDHEPTEAELKLWDRTCDRCRTYCPPEVGFYTGHVARQRWGTRVVLTFGVCKNCKAES
jgi:hypothetical protein